MFYYRIQHTTHFYYSQAITESMMELRTQPCSDHQQRCLRFQTVVSPKAKLNALVDNWGNQVHLFDVPVAHSRLVIQCESVVEVLPFEPLPDALPMSAWDELAPAPEQFERYDMLLPSHFVRPSPALSQFWDSLDIHPHYNDPLTAVRHLNTRLYEAFEYVQDETAVDSPIELVLESRRGVCQDFVHVMIALLRHYYHIPTRYVSGYLFHQNDQQERSATDATHAWAEAWLPTLGWVGFDPTNNVTCAERHIRVAVGRDYVDVPPTKGVYKGESKTRLKVGVKVEQLSSLPTMLLLDTFDVYDVSRESLSGADIMTAQQQQQQQ